MRLREEIVHAQSMLLLLQLGSPAEEGLIVVIIIIEAVYHTVIGLVGRPVIGWVVEWMRRRWCVPLLPVGQLHVCLMCIWPMQGDDGC